MTTKNKPIKRIVLTGGPGVGKSTIINLLSDRGYSIIPEAARIIIEKEQKIDSDCLPWKNISKFQEAVSNLQLNLEERAQEEIVFLDRGLIDGHAYSKIDKVAAPKIIYSHSRERYNAVFLLDPLPVYKKDEIRWDDEERAKIVHKTIAESYKTFGYNPIAVPVLSPESRLDFILNNLKEGKINERF